MTKTFWITNEVENNGLCGVWDVEPEMGEKGFYAKGRSYLGLIPNGSPFFGYILAGHCVKFEIKKDGEE